MGRRGPVGRIVATFDEVAHGGVRVVCVEGEAGMGKSSLIDHALARCAARAEGVTTLRAGGDEAEADLGYGLVEQLLAPVDARTRARHPLVAGRPSPHVDPMVLGGDLLEVLAELSRSGPLVVVIDDLQWVDELSTAALLFALRRLRHDPVLVLLGTRPRGVDPRWGRLVDSAPARRVPLAGLEALEISELADALGRPLASSGAAARVRHHTGGHPLHVRRLLEDLPPDALAATTGVLPVPRSLDSAVLARLARASGDAQDLVVAAAVLGVVSPLAQVAALGRPVDAAAALDEAVRAGLLVEQPGPTTSRVGFAHPLLRAAVYADLAPARRRELHHLAGELVGHRSALGHRIAAATGPDEALAAELEEAAADPTSDPLVVADLLRAAGDLSAEPADRARRLCAGVDTLLAHGEIRRAMAWEPDIDHVGPGARHDELLGRLALLSGRLTRARGLLDAAHRALAPTGPGDGRDPARGIQASVDAHRALLHVLDGEPLRAVELAASAVADPTLPAEVRRPAGFALVLGLAASGRGADAGTVLELAAGPAGARTDLHADTLALRGILAALADDDETAAEQLGEAVRRGRAGERVRTLVLAVAFDAVVRERRGGDEAAGALEALEVVVAAARDGGTAFAGGIAHGLAAQILALRGRGDDARAHLARAREASAPWWGATLSTAVAGATVALAGDDPPEALKVLEPALRPELLALADGLGFLAPRILACEALVAGGATPRAQEALEALDVRLADCPPGRHAVDVARLRGLLAVSAGHPERARAILERAQALGAGLRAPLALARLEIELARLLFAAGERRAAVDLVRTARSRVPAGSPFLARGEQLLRDAGLTQAPGHTRLGLTPHEEAVVALVVRGLTNREVGRDLFVTPRTVAYHLSNVYAKLGVASRRELREHLGAGPDWKVDWTS